MRFGLSEEQQELARAVRTLAERRTAEQDIRAAATGRGFDETLWSTLCGQIGVAALAVPEEYGGAGFTSFETHVVLEQLGATLAPAPLLGSGVLGAQAILLSAAPEDCARLLPNIADGTAISALAWADGRGRWRTDGSDVRADHRQDWTLTGTATLVLDGTHADVLLVVADTGAGPGLFEVDPTARGVTTTETPALDPTLRLATIDFVAAQAQPLAVDAQHALERLHAVAAIAVTALQVGGAQSALDRTVTHLRERVQFERQLGSFQALKHRVADMLVSVETARSVSWAAGWAAAHATSDLVLQAARAKAWCGDAFDAVAAEMIQLHGGVGITWEHDAQLYFKRAHATAQLFGHAREHRRRLLE